MSQLKDQKQWSGVWTALITPFTGETWPRPQICEESLNQLINNQIQSGIDGLVIAGSTGEGSLLPPDEYERLLRLTTEIVSGRVPLVAGIGIGGTHSCLVNAELAAKHGFDALLASPPAYVKGPQRGLVSHYLQLTQVGLPICLYEVAGRAASSIALDTIETILEKDSKNLVLSTKDASADILRALETSQRFGDRLALLSGDDFTVQAFIASGGQGVISVASHVIPKSMKALLEQNNTEEQTRARRIQQDIQALLHSLFADANPIPVKSLCHSLGWIKHSSHISPLQEAEHSLKERLLVDFNEVKEKWENLL